jgi:hypothetical protein
LKWFSVGNELVAGALKVGFIIIEGLKSKINNDFLDLLETNYCFYFDKSWAGFETCSIKGYTSYIKGRNKITRFGRYPGGLVVSVKNSISKKVNEVSTEMKKISTYKFYISGTIEFKVV